MAPLAMTAAALVGVSGCTLNDVDGKDTDRLFPLARAVLEFDPPREPGDYSRRFRQGIELEVSGTGGSVGLSDGFGGVDYDLIHGALNYRFGLDSHRVEVYGLVGFANDRLELSGSPTIAFEENYFGPSAGVELRVRARDWMFPYFRFKGYAMEQASHARTLETGVAFAPVEGVDLFLAYRRHDAEYGDSVTASRDLNLELRGVVVGFGIEF